jgi:phosphatidylserine decarboxylase
MIDRTSYGAIAIIYIFSLAVGFVFIRFVRLPWLVWPMLALLLWFCVWQTTFFRVPRRRRTGSDKIVTSVAQGKVVVCDKVFENEYLKRECIQVSVYMNFFDVHANFWPVDGKVTYYRYKAGEHFLAFEPKTSLKNEHNCVCITTADGTEVLFKQIAGGFARRISSFAKEGLEVRSGGQCGIIKFGSRVDMFLPPEAVIYVKKGDLVRSAESVIARLP